MANCVTWKDDYLIGVDVVDQQHQYLFDLINKTLKCKEKSALQVALFQLYKYTREHFRDEEALMKEANYINYEQHQEQHNLLITALNEKSHTVLNNPEKRSELDIFLLNWLALHILEEDMQIGEFLRNNEIKKSL